MVEHEEKGTPPPSYDDAVEMKKPVKKDSWFGGKDKKGSDKEDDQKKEEEKEPEIPPVGIIELVSQMTQWNRTLIT